MANAIAVVEIGTNAMTVAAANPTITVPAGGVPQGAMIVFAFVTDGTGAETGVSDTQGNSYFFANSVTFNTSGDRLRTYFGYAKTALVSGNTITLSIGATILQIQAFYITGQAWGEYNEAKDSVELSKSNAATATAITASAIGPTKQADAIILGFFGYANTGTFTPTSPWVQTGLTNKVSSNTFSLACCYQIVTAVGTYTPTATLGTTSVYGAATVAIRASMARLLRAGASTAVLRAGNR